MLSGREKFLTFKKKKEISVRQSSTLPTTIPSQPKPKKPQMQEGLNLRLEVLSLRSEISDLCQRYKDELSELRSEIRLLRASLLPPDQPSVPQSIPFQHPATLPVPPTLNPVSPKTVLIMRIKWWPSPWRIPYSL